MMACGTDVLWFMASNKSLERKYSNTDDNNAEGDTRGQTS